MVGQLNQKKIENNLQNFNLYQIFCHFALFCFPLMGPKFFEEVFFVMILYLNGINNNGKYFYLSRNRIDKANKKQRHGEQFFENFSLVSDHLIILEISNLFITDLFYKSYKNNPQLQEMAHFGDSEQNIYNLVFIVKILMDWMKIIGYTEYKPEINIDI